MALSSKAQIFQWTDRYGNVHFSDKPHKGAKEVELPPAQTFTPPKIPMKPLVEQNETDTPRTYEKIVITQPEDQATVRNNQGYVAVSVLLEPALVEGDKLQLMYDGEPMGEPQTASVFALNNVYRGAHTLLIKVLNSKNKEIGQSQQVTFYMHRAHIGGRRGR